jgi:hypothetical protein
MSRISPLRRGKTPRHHFGSTLRESFELKQTVNGTTGGLPIFHESVGVVRMSKDCHWPYQTTKP